MQDNTQNFNIKYEYTSDMMLSLEQLRDLYYAGVTEGRVRQVTDDFRLRYTRKDFEQALGNVLSGKGISENSLPDAYKDHWEKNIKGDEY